MPTKPSDSQKSVAAERLFRKEETATQGAKAMAEYQAGVEARTKNTARLRELRLAKEAADKNAKGKPEREPVPKGKASASRTASRKKAIPVSKLNATNDG